MFGDQYNVHFIIYFNEKHYLINYLAHNFAFYQVELVRNLCKRFSMFNVSFKFCSLDR